MDITELFIDLVKTTCVIIAFAYVLTRTGFFAQILRKNLSLRNQLILMLLFGALSIFGTYGGINLPSGAIANIRDLGPMVGGMLGGPLVGLGAGIIGGVHRYLLGGFVSVPCGIASVVAGLAGGLIYYVKKGEIVRVWQGMLVAAVMECIHMGLTLLIARPYDDALAVVEDVALPMIAANALGVGIFIFIVRNLIIERRTAAEKENYRRELERTEFEMQTAKEIQQSFLPESPPDIPGFDLAAISLPASQVGGDFYDFIPVGRDKLGIVIADVSGKGVPAALFMALSRAIVRANAEGEPTVSEIIRRANRTISQEAKLGMFVTMFYGVLDTRQGVLSYVNAGHNPPFLYSQTSGDIHMLRARGVALGVLDGASFEQREIALKKGDIVVFYTDGITEAMNDSEELYGNERLTGLVAGSAGLPAREIAGKIKDDVFAFAQDRPQHDDFTLVVMKATGDGASET